MIFRCITKVKDSKFAKNIQMAEISKPTCEHIKMKAIIGKVYVNYKIYDTKYHLTDTY
ncbi:hypothetical protein CWI38_0826p0030 [Hamiltosporidium tvaerminnensis]|uniref:Uncharacterized protein n=1 Tax=Hamiltosporidium tvaerminnensis TaxID=1176355 RepID=A0A4Q9LUD4_9MICR|nr:hypothetical protein CWI38_0826p0030 [Hamiltosporidium tvaerminnensis]